MQTSWNSSSLAALALVLLLNMVAKKGEVVRYLVSERRPLFSADS